MIDSQEIIERSIYSVLLKVAIGLGYSIDPNEYLPINEENSRKLSEDIGKLAKYVAIYGTGNSSSKDQKITPRIVVNARGFYPGAVGLPKENLEKTDIGFINNEEPYETLDQYIDVHLVANSQEDLRLLHTIMFTALPQRGYIKPYNVENFLPSGNIFLEVGNFFDYPNNNIGILEKVYEFKVYDTLINEKKDIPTDIVPITSIDLIIKKYHEKGLHILHLPEADFNDDFNDDFDNQ